MSIHSIHTPLRKTAAGLLLSVLVWICIAPLALAFVPQSTDCGMRCCRIKKSCCCRKGSHARQKQPAISARTCPPGCGHLPAAPIGIMAALAAAITAIYPLPALPAAAAIPALTASLGLLCFALFQRPPPCRLLATH